MQYSVNEILNVEKVSVLLQSFTKATGLVSALLDLEGNILCKSGWQDICTKFHRINKNTAQNCRESDTILGGKLKAGNPYNVYKCLNGLYDVAVPVIVNNKHICNLFTGQFFFEKPDKQLFLDQAKKYNFNETAYMNALQDVPLLKEEDVKAKLDFLLRMTEFIAEQGVARIRQMELNQSLKESEEKFRALYDNAPLCYQSLDENGMFIDANPTWLSTLGYSRDEVIGMPFASFLHPDMIPHFELNFPAFKKRGFVHDVQFKIRHKNGEYRDISFEGCIGANPDGSFKQTYCVFQDITIRVKAENELKKHKKNLEQLVKERTLKFEEKNMELEKLNRLFVDREFRIRELKDQIKNLKKL